MSLIELFSAPQLPATTPLRKIFELRMVFHGKQPSASPQNARLLFALLLAVDKAHREYSAGHAALSRYAAAGHGDTAFIEGVGQFENCLNALSRALRLLDALASRTNAPSIDRATRKRAQVALKEVMGVRNAIEHIEDDIRSPAGLNDGDPHVLFVDATGDRLQIADKTIAFSSVHATVTALQEACTRMIDELPGPS